MLDQSWFEHTSLASLLFALPAAVLLFSVWFRKRQHSSWRYKTSAGFRLGVSVLLLYAGSIANYLFQWSDTYDQGWGLFGVVLSLLGVVMSFSAQSEERASLVVANVFLATLCFIAI